MQPKTASSRHYQCMICFATFVRREHLERHKLSHSKSRPFSCKFCGTSYARKDVLRRHAMSCSARGERAQDPRSSPPPSKGRIRSACDRCARLKHKCDRSTPCRRCRENNETCTWIRTNGQSSGQSNLERSAFRELVSAPDSIEKQSTSNQSSHVSEEVEHAVYSVLDTTSALDDTTALPPRYRQDPYKPRAPSIGQIQPPDGRLRLYYQDGPYNLEYLARFTSATSFVDSFECCSVSERLQLVSRSAEPSKFYSFSIPDFSIPYEIDHNAPIDGWPIDGLADSEFLMDPNSYLDSSGFVLEEDGTNYSAGFNYDEPASEYKSIIASIKETVLNKTETSSVKLEWSSAMEQACQDFFSPSNVHKFLDLFWNCWYPNCPIIHRPTFSTTPLSPILIASMVLIGASLSPSDADVSNAAQWYDVVGEMAFSRISVFADLPSLEEKCSALQAAYFVSLYHNWQGSTASKRRIRRYRYGTLVAVVRDLELVSLGHLNYQLQDIATFDWDQFLLKEQIVRTIAFIFLLDTAFFVFYNIPPRMEISELGISLPCPEICFQADSATACFTELKKWQNNIDGADLSLLSLVKAIIQEDVPPNIWSCLVRLSTLNMFLLAHVLLALFYPIRKSALIELNFRPLRNGIGHWKRAWCTRPSFVTPGSHLAYEISLETESSLSNAWKRIGFIRHVTEYWLLANLFLMRMELEQRNLNRKPRITDAPADVEAIPYHRDRELSDTHDEASMTRLNQLIEDFRAFGFSLYNPEASHSQFTV